MKANAAPINHVIADHLRIRAPGGLIEDTVRPSVPAPQDGTPAEDSPFEASIGELATLLITRSIRSVRIVGAGLELRHVPRLAGIDACQCM